MSITTSIVICLGSLLMLLHVLRRDRISFGLPFAYLSMLLLIHVPGAYAHLLAYETLAYTEYVQVGIYYTAIGCICFVTGVWSASLFSRRTNAPVDVYDRRFAMFCLYGGWIFTFGLSFLRNIPSLGAAIDKGGAIWMLGIVIGIRAAVSRGDWLAAGAWFVALLVYPIVILVLGGFLSYGSSAVIIVLSVLVVSAASRWKVVLCAIVATVVGLNVFVNYFAHRAALRAVVWHGAPIEERIDATLQIFRDFELLDSGNEEHMKALDTRLNQNFFVGLAATRIEAGSVEYLYGQSLWEGVLALVPRAVWPEKPVVAGSGRLVPDMTGLPLSETTSWGVGNVMELEINFGLTGIVVGFFLIGFVLQTLDRVAAVAERGREYAKAIFAFLSAVALIQPGGSVVEMIGGAAAGFIGAFLWRWLWRQFEKRAAERAARFAAHSARFGS